MEAKRKVVRSTHAQIRLLVDYMSTNPLFAAGEFTGPLGSQKMEAEWVKLKDLLSEKGPEKSVEQWKHTWRDLKKKARDEGGRARYARGVTGNETIVPEISDISQKILGTIGKECAIGIGAEGETAIGGSVLDEEPVAEQAPDQPSASASIETDPPGPNHSPPRRLPAAPRRRRTRIPSREGPMAQYLAIMKKQTTALEINAAANTTTARLLKQFVKQNRSSPVSKLNFN